MPKFIIGLFATILFTAVCAGPVSAGTPLDPTGKLTGFVPPSKGVVKCERYMNKRVTVASNCVLKCHIKKNDALLKNHPFDDDLCEDTAAASCKAKYDRSLGALDQSLCPLCLNLPAQQGLYAEYRNFEEAINASIYCDDTNSVPFGDDDTGFASLQRDISKCEDSFARNVAKLIKCLNLKCHRNLAEDIFFGKPQFDNFACEETDPVHSCEARFLADTADLAGCPPCLDAAHRAQAFATIQQGLDSRNGLVYCGQ